MTEIKGLLPVIGRPSSNQRAVFDYLEGACLDHSEATFFEGIRQLPPAHTLTVETQVIVRRYWDFPTPGSSGLSMRDAAECFRHLFRDAVRLRLRSDVPIGTCLSGGLDSSSIVCVANDLMFVEHTMDEESSPPLKQVPMGTSLRRRSRTASRKRCRKHAAASRIERPLEPGAGKSQYRRTVTCVSTVKVCAGGSCRIPSKKVASEWSRQAPSR